MKRTIILAALAAFILTTPASAGVRDGFSFCVAPYEWCQLSSFCQDLGAYVADTFPSWEDALPFLNALQPIQRETARIVVLQQARRHVVIVYRLATGQMRAPDPDATSCPISRPVTLRGFMAIETAMTELAQLPLDTRATASVVAVPPVPNLSNESALLLYLEGPNR